MAHGAGRFETGLLTGKLAPQVGFEPTTLRLTAGCSAIELLRSVWAASECHDLQYGDYHSILLPILKTIQSRESSFGQRLD